MRHIIPFILLLACLGSATAAETQAELYKKWHDACLAGGTEEIDAEIKKYEARLAAKPDDHLAQAYLGSACALRAKAGFWGPTKLSFLKRGEKLLNGAVAAAPKDARVRTVRAIAYFRIPKRFKVRATSIADFKVLIPVAKSSKGSLKTNERQVILYYAYLAFSEEGEASATELKTLCHKIDPASAYGKLTK